MAIAISERGWGPVSVKKMTERRVTALVFAVCLIASAHAQKPDHRSPEPVATFSILGFDPATGEIGGAVQSRVFSVGNGGALG